MNEKIEVMHALPQTIDEVIEELNAIIEDAVEKNNYNAIFAYVYKRTTIEIKKAIEDTYFEDNQGMEVFDVLFANLYIKAYHGYQIQSKVSACWQKAFDEGKIKLTYLQHLLLGMNAHINFDLGVAAAIYTKNSDIEEISNDFRKVNQILFNLTNEMQSKLARVSPMLFLLDILGGKNDEMLSNFGIKMTRGQAWRFARNLWQKHQDEQSSFQSEVDGNVALIASKIAKPRFISLKVFLWCIGKFERKPLIEVLQILND